MTETEQKDLKTRLMEAKATGNPALIRKAIIDALQPEALEAIAMAEKDISTKDGYGTILRICGSYPRPYNLLFLDACIAAGYPSDTGNTIRSMFGN